MTAEQLKNILEAALMTSDGAMSLNRFLSLFEKDAEQPEKAEVKEALEQLQNDYEGRGVELKEVASGFRFQVRNEYAEWVNRLFDERPQRYSRALLETLAIIAYRQPITRGEIEDIRGVSISSSIIKTLQEREWIRIVGHRDVPGKPELLASTKQFLDYFNLKKLSDLPSLAEIKDFDKINPDLFEGLEQEKLAEEAETNVDQETQTNVSEINAAENVTEEDHVDAEIETDVDQETQTNFSEIKAAENVTEEDHVDAEIETDVDQETQTNFSEIKEAENVTGEDHVNAEAEEVEIETDESNTSNDADIEASENDEAENDEDDMEIAANDNVVPFSS
jgi:segregation and condensation protein B